MGGNIFKGMSRRYTTEEYFDLIDEVEEKLERSITNDAAGSLKVRLVDIMTPIQSFYSKDSFGDMDIIINSKYLENGWIPELVSEFNLPHGHWVKNGNIFSFLYKEFQIDLIITPDEDYQSSRDYFAWNDLGNLIGRISHKFGIKFGHRGSHLIIRDGTNKIGEILITKNTEDMLDFIGLDANQWSNGFVTMEDAYKWVSSTKYFNKDIYNLDNRNHASKVRDKKRVNYANFIEWINTQDNLPNYPYEDVTDRGGYNIREPFFTMICERYPYVKDEYEAIINKYNDEKIFKTKFNGELAREYTKLEGKELGAFMAWARDEIDRTGVKHLFMKYKEHSCKLLIESLYFHYTHNQPFLRFNYQLAVKLARNEGLVQM